MKLESSRLEKRKRVQVSSLDGGTWNECLPRLFLLLKGGSLRSVDVSPPKDRERLPTVVPKSEVEMCAFREKKPSYTREEETHGERRSRTVHNWHAAGGFHCPPPLCMQRGITHTHTHIYGSQGPARSSPLRRAVTAVVVVAFSLLCLFYLVCVCVRSF